jgi:hypothetical protein
MIILKRIVLFIMLTLLIVTIGCSSVPIKIDSSPKRAIDTTKGRVIKADSCGFQLFLLIPIMVNGRQDRAYHDLLMYAGGDYVTDVKVKESWIYGFVGTAYCTELQAIAYPYMMEK